MWLLFKRTDGLYQLTHESDLATLCIHPDLDRYVVTLRSGVPAFEAVHVETFHTLVEAIIALTKSAEEMADQAALARRQGL